MSKSKPKNPMGYMEKLQGQIAKDLKEKNFSTMEEANKYIQENYLGKEVAINHSKLSEKEQAMNLIYDAWESETEDEMVSLAEKALKLDENCADAYNILAESKATTHMEALEYYAKGIEAGKKSLGDDFDEFKGRFWGFHETRPYMRAMRGYALILWAAREKSKSVEVMKEMLFLNPNDNQGIRYLLVTKLLILKRFVEAEKLCNDNKDDTAAVWLYSKAYLYYNKRSKQLQADQALKEAMEYNPYVPLYLLDLMDIPEEPPQFISAGSEEEAVEYVLQAMELWAANEKALDWFVRQFKKMHARLDTIIELREKEAEERRRKFGNNIR